MMPQAPALIPCPACGNGVSSAAQACPRCGHPLQVAPAVQPSAPGPYAPGQGARNAGARTSNLGLTVMLIGGLGMLGGCVYGCTTPNMVAGGTLGFVGFIFAVVGRAMMAAK